MIVLHCGDVVVMMSERQLTVIVLLFLATLLYVVHVVVSVFAGVKSHDE